MSLDIDGFVIADTLRQILEDDPYISSVLNKRSKEISVNNHMNVEPSFAPWVGVYLLRENIVPTSLPKGYKATIDLTVATEFVSHKSPNDCTRGLGDLNKLVINSIINNTGLRQVVDMVNTLDIDFIYSVDSEQDELYFQAALINLTLEVSGNAR